MKAMNLLTTLSTTVLAVTCAVLVVVGEHADAQANQQRPPSVCALR